MVDMAKVRQRKRAIVESQGDLPFRTEGGIIVPVVTAEQMQKVDRIAVAGDPFSRGGNVIGRLKRLVERKQD
jgi:hypothetical protein